MAPRPGLEPGTCGLTALTAELFATKQTITRDFLNVR
jgi:hypothetical protein